MTSVGIDVSKATLDIAIVHPDGRIEQNHLPNHPTAFGTLTEQLTSLPDVHVGLEATSSYHVRVTHALDTAGILVSVLDPRQVHHFMKSLGRRNKTDAIDAVGIAGFVRERQPAPTGVHSTYASSLAREIAAVSKDLQRLRNRLEASERNITHPKVLDSLRERIDALTRHKEELEEALEHDTRATRANELALVTSIPGVGVRTACVLLAHVGNVERFATARKLVAFVGLNPTVRTSGTSVRGASHISRAGSSHVRHALFMPTLAAIRHNSVIGGFHASLVEAGKPRMVAVVACMAKLLKIVFGVLKNQRPFDPTHAARPG